MSDERLPPGVYSVFVLRDDETWSQPIYRTVFPMTEVEIRSYAEQDCGGFISYGLQEDTEAPADAIRAVDWEPKLMDVEYYRCWGGDSGTWDTHYISIPANTPEELLDRAVQHAASKVEWRDGPPQFVGFYAMCDDEDDDVS